MTGDPRQKPITVLLSEGLEQMSRLMRGEVELARAEVREALAGALVGMALLSAAALMAITALNVLAGALVAMLAESGVKPSLASAAVALGFAVAAAVLLWMGRRALRPVKVMPRRTARQLQQDAKLIKETVSDDRP